jgi:DNA primase
MAAGEVELLREMASQELQRLYDGTVPWVTWLDRAARYGSYGFTNTLLIAAQTRAATRVESFEGWVSLGRHVRRGEHGIRILSQGGAPHSVFDLSQTVGPALPDVKPLAVGLLREQAVGHGLMVSAGADASVASAHGLAHLLLHRTSSPDEPCAGELRVEADSVAYLVLTRLGVDPVPVILGPVPGWADPDHPYATIRRVGERVLRTAARVERLLGTSPPLLRMHAAAHAFFQASYASSWAPHYLTGRGLTDVARWELGYAPSGRHALADHLRDLGFPAEQIMAGGLARRDREGRLADTFRDRLMFPLRSPAGEVVAFIGRRRDDGPGPKYLNSPDTSLFTKGSVLYGLHEAVPGARAVLVEGPMDVLAVAAAGPEWAPMAPCGTAVTSAHALLVGPGAVVALDNDRAGRAAAIRAWPILRAPVDWAAWPPGQDPADLTGDPDAIRRALQAARPLADLVVDTRIDEIGGTLEFSEQRWSAAQAAATVIARLPPDQAARQVTRTAARLGLPPSLITDALLKAISP